MSYTNSQINDNANKPLHSYIDLTSYDDKNITFTKQGAEICPKSELKENTIQKNIDKKIFEKDNKDDLIPWTTEKLKNKLYNCLLSTRKDGKRKYKEQAKELFYRLSVDIPTPPFIINDSDLSPELIDRLNRLAEPELDSVIRKVLKRIFEPINKEYFWKVIHRNNLLQGSFEL